MCAFRGTRKECKVFMNNTRLKELLIHLQNNQMDYFDEFYNLTKNSVFYMAYSVLKSYTLCEDVLQEVYLKFLKHVKKVKADENILGYLMMISKNISLNVYKKRKREIQTEDFDYLVDKTEKEHSDLIFKMKKILNDEEFQIVVLHVINDLAHREIAEMLGKPLGTITWSYSNAIKKLRRDLDGKED